MSNATEITEALPMNWWMQDEMEDIAGTKWLFVYRRQHRLGSERFDANYFTEVGQQSAVYEHILKSGHAPASTLLGFKTHAPLVVDYSSGEAVEFTELEAERLPHLAPALARLRVRIASEKPNTHELERLS